MKSTRPYEPKLTLAGVFVLDVSKSRNIIFYFYSIWTTIQAKEHTFKDTNAPNYFHVP